MVVLSNSVRLAPKGRSPADGYVWQPWRKEEPMADLHALKDGLIVTAFWEAKPGEAGAVLDIVKRYLPQAQREQGVQAFQIHQSLTEPEKFFFYEVFKDDAAFAAHQQTAHFKALIQGEALPRLAKRERTQHRFV
jgi:quinol monooxygenase YgiN